MDFLLKIEQVAIEVKKASQHLTGAKLFDQLTIDIARYKEHPDCRTLVCFIYDPERHVNNPKGLENDLSKQSDTKLQVKAFVFPKS